MHYYSLNNTSSPVSFREAAIQGQASDGGLYFPAQIPAVNADLIAHPNQYEDWEIAFHVLQPFIGRDMPETVLFQLLQETFCFPIPLVQVNTRIAALELFHGPTLAFKDVGARFMSRCLGYFSQGTNRQTTVLVATSGDTGSAVAHGFYEVDGVQVVILYPSGKVSRVQEQQLTTLGKNIKTLEVSGAFDDCQQLVKQAFSDRELNQKLSLTSANSINVARWLPQQCYYFFAWKQWRNQQNPPVVSVPSGNFGNICAGLLACAGGLPLRRLIAACNANDVVPTFLSTQTYQPKAAVQTISNAMDVGNPSNFVRILELFQLNKRLKNIFSAVSISDETTKNTMRRVFDQYGYTLDPHGAVGFSALEKHLENHPDELGMFLETAHPVKFYDVVEPVLQQRLELPPSVQSIMNLEKKATRIPAQYDALRAFLEQNG